MASDGRVRRARRDPRGIGEARIRLTEGIEHADDPDAALDGGVAAAGARAS